MSFSLPALGTVYHPLQGLGVIKSAFAPNNEMTCLRCPHYAFQLMTGLIEVLGDQHWQDVTLECCDGHSVRSSKIFLAACSPYFRQVLTQQDSKVYLSGITLEVLEILLVFMSQGNIDVSPHLLLDVIDAATSLQIQGFQTALSQYLKQNNNHLDTQYEADMEVLKEDAGSESFNNEQAFPSFSHGAATLPKVPLSTSTIISAEPARATEAISAPPDSLLEISPLVTSTLENLLQPTSTTGTMLGTGFQGTLQSLDNIPDSSTIFSFEKTKKGRGRPRQTEFTVESQKHKSGSGSPKTLSIETKKSNKYREWYVKLQDLKKDRELLKKSEEHTHPSNSHKMYFETEKSKRGLDHFKTINRLGHPIKSEFTDKSQEPKRGSEFLQTFSVDTKKPNKGPGRPKKSEEIRLPNKGRELPKKSDELNRLKNASGISFGCPKMIKRIGPSRKREFAVECQKPKNR